MSKGVVIPEIYRDTGCYLYPSCLECPFPLIGDECLFYTQGAVQTELRKAEARELARQGKSATEIADAMGLSKRQVERYLCDFTLLTT